MVETNLILYGDLLQRLKEKIKSAQQKAILAVNNEMLSVYWEIGNIIFEQEQQAGWGGKTIDKLAADLKTEFPKMKGLSPRNLRYMRDFALAYPEFLQQPAAKAESSYNKQVIILQQLVAKLPWGHHQILLTRIRTKEERLFYIRKSVENSWSRSILEHQIDSNLYTTQGALINNFNKTVPASQSKFTTQIFKDPYNLDFIMLGEQAKERDLEDALMNNVTKVLLELGNGFAFMGRQRKFEAGGREFFIDLLFYHTKLRRHVVIELKTGDFEPEYVSKMNLYLGLADDQLKGEHDEAAIGLILCRTNNKIVAEYALRDTSKPIGIAEYKIAQQLPEHIKGELPMIEEIEQRLDEEIKETKNSIADKLTNLKNRISQLKTEEAIKKNPQIVNNIYVQFLNPFYENCYNLWKKEIIPLFNEYEKAVSINGNEAIPYYTNADLELAMMKEEIFDVDFRISFNGFKKAGAKAFNVFMGITIQMKPYCYIINLRGSNMQYHIEKLYTELPSSNEIQNFEDKINHYLIDEVDHQIGKL